MVTKTVATECIESMGYLKINPASENTGPQTVRLNVSRLHELVFLINSVISVAN